MSPCDMEILPYCIDVGLVVGFGSSTVRTKTHPWVELDFEIMGNMAGAWQHHLPPRGGRFCGCGSKRVSTIDRPVNPRPKWCRCLFMFVHTLNILKQMNIYIYTLCVWTHSGC